MCGFGVELRRGRARRTATRSSGCSAALAPRGPDGDGLWVDGGVGLVHRRLAIIDLSERGAQPMRDDALGLAIVFNGCIYNHRELRARARARSGTRSRSHADTEVLLKGWREWGEGLLDRLAGMFAFCLLETAAGAPVLVRDRLGHQAALPGRAARRRAARRVDAARAAWRPAASTRASTRSRCTTT